MSVGSFALLSLKNRQPLLHKHVSHLLGHNLSGGKRIRSKLIIATARCYPSVVSLAPLIDAVEVMHSGFLIADDCCDYAQSRRGRPAWRKVANDDNKAWNDANLLCLTAKAIIHDNYNRNPSCEYVSRLFDEGILETIAGQHYDMSPLPRVDKYTYRRLVSAKTGAYTFRLPVMASMALSLSEVPERKVWRATEELSATLAELYQGHNDIRNALGDEPVENPSDVDLQRPTWIKCYGLCNASDKVIAKEFDEFTKLKLKQATEEALYINEITGKLLGTRIMGVSSQFLPKG